MTTPILLKGHQYVPGLDHFGSPDAHFVGDILTGNAPLLVQFTDQSTAVIFGWDWTFGDGEASHQQNPQHIYSAAGTYDVALTVHGPGGSNTLTRNGYVVVS